MIAEFRLPNDISSSFDSYNSSMIYNFMTFVLLNYAGHRGIIELHVPVGVVHVVEAV